LATELRALGVEAEYIHADVRHEEDVRGLVDGTVKRFGRLDVAVNTAGTEGKPGPIAEQTAENRSPNCAGRRTGRVFKFHDFALKSDNLRAESTRLNQLEC